MELLKIIGRAVGNAAEDISAKHRKTALLNRIRTVIRCEERAAEKEYMALGRYYYNTLRDKSNPVAEPHCEALDKIEERLDAALSHMQAVASENWIGSIGVPEGSPCPCGDEEYEEIDLSDVESYDEDPGLGTEAAAGRETDGPEENTLPFEG